MIIDKLTELADAASADITGTGRKVIGTAIDLAPAGDLGAGQPLYLVCTVDTAFTSGSSATVSFELVSDAQSPVAVDATATQHAATKAFPVATLVAGFKFAIPLPGIAPDYEQYLGLITNIGTAALTAGKLNAFLADHAPDWKAYADGQN